MSKTRESKTPAKKKTNPSRVNLDSGAINQPEMKTSEIRDLIDFISKSGLNEVNIETKELKLSVKREPDQKVFKSTPVVTQAQHLLQHCICSCCMLLQPAAKAEAAAAAVSSKKQWK